MREVFKLKWLRLLIFWGLSIYVIASYFSISNTLSLIDFVYSLFFHISLLFLVVVNKSVLIKNFLEEKRYVFYLLGAGVAVTLSILLHNMIFDYILPTIQDYFYIVSFTEKVILINIFLIYITISTLLHLSQSWFTMQQLEQEKTVMELSALRSQLNPHFLFNGLNSIYSLALKKDIQTPSAILKLSELLRYVLYDVQEEKVLLTDEAKQMENYITLQKLRTEEKIRINYDFKIRNQSTRIYPLLFMPIIENAFKHGPKGNQDGFISFAITEENRSLIMNCRNTMAPISWDKPGSGGIGLKNLEKRLELYYPNKYKLTINDNDGIFELNLKIEIK